MDGVIEIPAEDGDTIHVHPAEADGSVYVEIDEVGVPGLTGVFLSPDGRRQLATALLSGLH